MLLAIIYCQVKYTQVMGGKESKIESLAIEEHLVKSGERQKKRPYVAPQRKYGQVARSQSLPSISYRLQVHSPFNERIDVKSQKYNPSEAQEAQLNGLILEGAIPDQKYQQRWLFQGKKDEEQVSMLIRPFSSDQSKRFASILCQVHFAEEVGMLSYNLHKMMRTYSADTNIKTLKARYSQVLVMEPVNASLSQVIAYRRQSGMELAQQEFQRMTNDLVLAVSALHAKKVAHCDIRPSNVYFSSQKNCYVLGGYGSCCRVNDEHQQGGEPQGGNKRKEDIKMLATTLLSAFYLTEPVDENVIGIENQVQGKKYKILRLLDNMMKPEPERPDIETVRQEINTFYTSYGYQNAQEVITSMKESVPVDTKGIGWGYQRLGKVDEWKQTRFAQSEEEQEHASEVDHADALLERAFLHQTEDRPEESQQSAKKAAVIYRRLGKHESEEGDFDDSLEYYQKAVGCSKFYKSKNDLDLAQTFRGMAWAYAGNDQYPQAKQMGEASSKIIERVKGTDSIEYINGEADLGAIDTQYAYFDDAQQNYQRGLKIVDHKDLSDPKVREAKANLLIQRGGNGLKYSQYIKNPAQARSVVDQSTATLEEGIRIYDSLGDAFNSQEARGHFYMGQNFFKREQYGDAIEEFTTAIKKIDADVDKSNDRYPRMKGDILAYRGRAFSFQGESKKALRDYDEAMRFYERLYGSNQNRWSALAIGNLARVYANNGDENTARECLRQCKDILRETAGEDDADYIHFETVEAKLNEYMQE